MENFKAAVEQHHIPTNIYALDGLASNGMNGRIYDDMLILEKTRYGYVVFHFEKGRKNLKTRHADLSAALGDLFERLLQF